MHRPTLFEIDSREGQEQSVFSKRARGSPLHETRHCFTSRLLSILWTPYDGTLPTASCIGKKAPRKLRSCIPRCARIKVTSLRNLPHDTRLECGEEIIGMISARPHADLLELIPDPRAPLRAHA